jgi:TonB family protein
MILTAALLVVLAAGAPKDSAATAQPDPQGHPAATPADRAPERLPRVPGSALRLGWTEERTSGLGSFVQQSASEDVTVRHGDLRWFGTTSTATLTYRAGLLASVRLECAKPTPALLSYVPDELRRAGYRRTSHVIEAGTERSAWTGPNEIALTATAASLVAEVSARGGEPLPVATNPSAPSSAPSSAPPVAAVIAAGSGATAARTGGGTLAATSAGAVAEDEPGALPGEIDFTGTRTDSLPAPRVVSTPPPPVRPRIAVDAGLFGRVQVRARVDTTGRVVHARIARGIDEFNSAALAWAADVRFEPYRVNGQPAPVVVLIPVVFAHADGGRPNP